MGKQARHGDLTARTKAQLLEEHAKEQQVKAQRMAMIDAQAQERKEGVIDLTDPNGGEEQITAPDSVDLTADEVQALSEPKELNTLPEDIESQFQEDEVQPQEVDVVDPSMRLVEFRVNESVPQVTIGVGNTFDLVEGQKYKAPKHVYDHLEEKGLIYH